MNALPQEQHSASQTPTAAAGANPVGTLQLNYWLSAFFMWLPALIFWILEKDKGDRRATALHVANLNFSLLRTAIVIATGVLGAIPEIGWILVMLGWLVGFVLFVFHVIAATKIPRAYAETATEPFILNVPMIK